MDDTRHGADRSGLPEAASDAPTVAGLEGSYRIIRLLGRGTMASVYLAEQLSMARPVALKILSPSLMDSPAFVDRFLAEARASARLNHPNIVSAIDAGESESRLFLAMEYVDGEALGTLLEREGPVDEKQAIHIGLQILSALAHASENNVVHLDIKPANIVICPDGRVKLADFGLAMMLDSPARAEMSRKAVGTPYYMSPEQVEGRDVDWRSDQFSLGATLYETVTGHKAYPGELISDVLAKRFFEKPPPAWKVPRNRVSRSFSAVLEKMLSRSREGRYQSFADLEGDFKLALTGKQPRATRVSTVGQAVPIGGAWHSLGYAGAGNRADSLLWRQRWNWLMYSSLLFLLAVGAYAVLHKRELVGPTPPLAVENTLLAEAETLPPDRGGRAREMWAEALAMAMQAEAEPGAATLRRALSGFRVLAKHREFQNTAYAAEAETWAQRLQKALRTLEAEETEDEAVSPSERSG